MTTLTATVRAPLTADRRYLAAVTFAVFGIIDIVVFGLLAHKGDASFALSQSGSGVQIPLIKVPATPVCFVLGVLSIAIGAVRGTIELSTLYKRLAIGGVLLFFLISLLCWADAGAIPLDLVNIGQGAIASSIPVSHIIHSPPRRIR